MTDASSNQAEPASPAGSGGQTREEFLKRAGAGAAVLFAGSGFAGLGASARPHATAATCARPCRGR